MCNVIYKMHYTISSGFSLLLILRKKINN